MTFETLQDVSGIGIIVGLVLIATDLFGGDWREVEQMEASTEPRCAFEHRNPMRERAHAAEPLHFVVLHDGKQVAFCCARIGHLDGFLTATRHLARELSVHPFRGSAPRGPVMP